MKDFTLPRRDLEINCAIWINGRDSHSHSPHQASFSPKSCHVVEIGSDSIVGIAT